MHTLGVSAAEPQEPDFANLGVSGQLGVPLWRYSMLLMMMMMMTVMMMRIFLLGSPILDSLQTTMSFLVLGRCMRKLALNTGRNASQNRRPGPWLLLLSPSLHCFMQPDCNQKS